MHERIVRFVLISIVTVIISVGCTPSLLGEKHVPMWTRSCGFTIKPCKQTMGNLSVEYEVVKTKIEKEYWIKGSAIFSKKGMSGVYEKIHQLKLPFYFLDGQTVVEKKWIYVHGFIDKPIQFNKFFKTDKPIKFSYIGDYRGYISEFIY